MKTKGIPEHYLFSTADFHKMIPPLIIEQLLAISVGLADSIMVAKVGEAAISAISLVDNVNILMINLFSAMAAGGSVLAGQFLGKRDKEKACKVTDQLLIFTTAIALVVMAFLLIFGKEVIHIVFGAIEEDVFYNARIYLIYVALSIPALAIYNGGAAVFRIMGDSKTAMIVSLGMNVVNVIGNAILIWGLGWGIEGAALPTLLSRILAAVVILWYLRKPTLLVHISRPFSLKLNMELIKKMLYLGVPSGIENSLFQVGKLMTLNLAATFGTSALTANAVAGAIGGFQLVPPLSINLAITTVIARCVGAGDYEQARFYKKKMIGWMYKSNVVVNLVFVIVLPKLIAIYRLSPETAHAVWVLLVMNAVCLIFLHASSFAVPNVLRSANDVKYTMVVSIVSMCIFRVGFSYVFGRGCNLGIVGIWMAMFLDWIVRGIFFEGRFRGHKWEQKRLV